MEGTCLPLRLRYHFVGCIFGYLCLKSSELVISRRGLGGKGEISVVMGGVGVIWQKGMNVVISGVEDGGSSVFGGLDGFFGILVFVVWQGGPKSRVELTVRSLGID